MEAMDKEEEIISRLKNLPGSSNKAKKFVTIKGLVTEV